MSPSAEQIAQWKMKYGHIYSFEYDETFYFRAITVNEYESLASVDPGLKSSASEDALVTKALLYPTGFNLDKAPAGLISMLAEEIWNVSAFGNPKYAQQLMQEYRDKLKGHLPDFMKVIILTAMPTCTEADLMDLSFDQLAYKTAIAEEILRLRSEMYSGAEILLDIIDPEEEELRIEEAKKKATRQKKTGVAVSGDPIASKLRRAGA